MRALLIGKNTAMTFAAREELLSDISSLNDVHSAESWTLAESRMERYPYGVIVVSDTIPVEKGKKPTKGGSWMIRKVIEKQPKAKIVVWTDDPDIWEGTEHVLARSDSHRDLIEKVAKVISA